MKRILLEAMPALMLVITALVLMPAPQIHSTTSSSFGPTTFCNPCPTASLRPTFPEREIFRAYAHSRLEMAFPDVNRKLPEESPLRRYSAIGLSWVMLLGGLILLARMVGRLIFGRGEASAASSWYSKTLVKRVLAVPVLAALAGLPLLVEAPAWLSFTAAGPAASTPSPAPLAITEINAASGEFRAAVQIGGSGTTQIGGTAIDRFGNLYVTGGFTGEVVFSTAPPTSLVSTADYDIFTAKYDPAGRFLWARAAHGLTTLRPGFSLDGGLTAAVDSRGNCYIGGAFVDGLEFKDAGNHTVTRLSGSGRLMNFESFVAKYDPDGTLLWARGGESGGPQHGSDLNAGVNSIENIVVDSADNPYVVGGVSGTRFLGSPVSVIGHIDAILARLEPDTGTPVWIVQPDSPRDSEIFGVAADGADNIYIIGGVQGVVTLPTVPPSTIGMVQDYCDTFIAKFDRNGRCLWAKAIGGSKENVWGKDVAVTSAGEIIVIGDFDGHTLTIGSTVLQNDDGYLAKFDTNGNPLWARGVAGDIERVTLDAGGNLYVAGVFFHDVIFGEENPTASQKLHSRIGEGEFIAKYDAAGTFQWAKALESDAELSLFLITSPEVNVLADPTRLAFNRLTGAMHLSGDFSSSLSLDGLTLNAAPPNRHGFVAALYPRSGLAFSAPTIDFGKVLAGRVSGIRSIVLTNNGEGPVVLGAILLVGPNPEDFLLFNSDSASCRSGLTLSPGKSCTVTAAFSSHGVGNRSAILSFASSESGTPHTVVFSGVGKLPFNCWGCP